VAAENAPETTTNSNLVPGAVEGEVFEGEVNFMRNVGGVDIVLSREEMENLRRFDQPGKAQKKPSMLFPSYFLSYYINHKIY
jgi:hypothetical protein